MVVKKARETIYHSEGHAEAATPSFVFIRGRVKRYESHAEAANPSFVLIRGRFERYVAALLRNRYPVEALHVDVAMIELCQNSRLWCCYPHPRRQ